MEFFNDYLSNNNISDLYLESYYDVEMYNELNSINKDEFVDVNYSVDVIRPVIVNKHDNVLKPLLFTEL